MINERWFARGVVALVVVAGAIALAPELDIARVDLNDGVFHRTIADAIVQRLAAGLPVLDFWMPEWSFGYPVVRDYQPLAHWLIVLGHFATFRQVPVESVFVFIRWLLLALFPLSAFAACRMIAMRPATGAAVALLAPLVAAPNLYGIDYGSYVWRGNGLYTQLVAMHLFVLAIGAGCRAIRGGKGVTPAGLLLALTFLAHFIYGYMAAATLVLVAALPGREASPRRRFVRLAWVAVLSLVISLFQIVPMLGDGPFINRSRWEPEWKWSSFGASQVLSMTASGDLLDGGRLPVLSLFALAGALAILRRREGDQEPFSGLFAICGAALWIFLFCGRAAWGPLFSVIGLNDAVQLHRFVGGVQWFLLLLAGIGLSRLWAMPFRRRWRFPGLTAAALTVILLASPVLERRHFLEEGYGWGRENLASYESSRDTLAEVIGAAKRLGGRAYPGLAATWGAQLRVGYVPLYAFLSQAHVPAVAFLYHAMALPADVMVRFDETRPEQYALFDVRSVIADAGRSMPDFLRPIASFGSFRIYQPRAAGGTFDVVRAPFIDHVDRSTFFDVNDAWLRSAWPAAKSHLLLDYESAVPTEPRPHLGSLDVLNSPSPAMPCGRVTSNSEGDDAYGARLQVAGDDCFALFKMTYHRNWRATVDGVRRQTVMLSPGFVGIPLTRGSHAVEVRYDGGIAKGVLLVLAFPLLLVAFVLERRGALQRIEERAGEVRVEWKPAYAYALLTFALVLPCVVPFLRNAQPNGHDALEYLPRVVEFHENVRHGILLPRWAPDLSGGQGQPLFLFNPPLFYYLSELFHLAGLSFIGSMNAACVAVILAAAASMFVLGRWYFGPPGGALAALAYVWAPYFLVDLYVRTAFAELSAFPFYPLAIYGFARHAAEGRRRYLILGSLAYAAVWFAHSPAAVLFSPLLGAFVVFLAWQARSVRLFTTHAIAVAVALLLAAVIWLPSIAEAKETHSNLLTEGPLKYSNHYVAPAQFFSNQWGYGVSVAGNQDGMPFSLGWPLLILAAAGAIAIVKFEPDERKRWLAFFAASLAVICFLMTQRAHAVWDAIPQLQYVAFPWRMLAPASFCLALLTAGVVVAIRRLPARWENAALAASVAAIVLSGVPHAKPASYLSLDETLWTPQEIAARNVIAATFDTFEPRWIQTRPAYAAGRLIVRSGRVDASIAERTPVRYVANVRAAGVSDLELPLSYFPGWRVRIDGVEQPPDPSPAGRMRLSVGPGAHRIEASFGNTPVRAAAGVMSLFGLMALIAAALYERRRARA